jgi:hypothetical protein
LIKQQEKSSNFPPNSLPFPGCPTPEVYYLEEIDSKRNGLIIMESLADKATPLGFYQSANPDQLFSLARCVANLHFQMDKAELRVHWENRVGYVYLDLFVDEFQITGFPLLKEYTELLSLIDQIKPIFDRAFCYYSLIDRPKEYSKICLGREKMRRGRSNF